MQFMTDHRPTKDRRIQFPISKTFYANSANTPSHTLYFIFKIYRVIVYNCEWRKIKILHRSLQRLLFFRETFGLVRMVIFIQFRANIWSHKYIITAQSQGNTHSHTVTILFYTRDITDFSNFAISQTSYNKNIYA